MPEQMLIDFSESSATAGFRLHSFEILNWGTFHRHIWHLPSKGGNSLVTGDIGSGKSTLVDGLTTLLVPPQRVIYNKAAGGDTRERDLRSYVLGYYKSEKNAETLEASAVALRDKNSYSVLIARFFNSGYEKSVTLGLVLWMPDKGRPPERFYIVSEDPLSIKDDFGRFGSDIRKLKKRLKKRKSILLFDSFARYSAAFMRRMGIQNIQALHLFFQTVSMKSVGNLTDFVRDHMLEAPPVGDRIDTLCSQFEDLNKAHLAVRRARDQVGFLEPLIAECGKYSAVAADIEQHIQYRSVLHAFFAEKKIHLLEEGIARFKIKEEKLAGTMEKTKKNLMLLKLREQELVLAVYENGGNRLDLLSRQIESLSIDRGRIQEQEKRYLRMCRELELPKPVTDLNFFDNRAGAQTRLSKVEGLVADQQNRQVEIKVGLKELEHKISSLEAELDSLKKRKNNIPLKSITLRKKISEFLKVGESSIPFCGELLRVKEKENEWEGAAERLLHNFSLSLLVPKALYPRVASYVDDHHLDGRIVYFKTASLNEQSLPQTHEAALCRKLEIKPDTPFYDWLENELYRRFNVVCCENMADFQRLPFAVTRHGQSKAFGNRHEKDDRFSFFDRTRFVLGWQNLEKIKALTQEYNGLQAQWDQFINQLKLAGREQKKLSNLKACLEDLLRIKSFTEIDWRALALRIKQLTTEKQALEHSSDILKTLNANLDETRAKIIDAEELKEKNSAGIGKVQLSLKNWGEYLKQAHAQLREIPEGTRDALFPDLVPLASQALGKIDLTVNNCDANQISMRGWLQDCLGSLREKKESSAQIIVRCMQEYKNAYTVETREIDAHVDAMDEYGLMLDTLLNEDLPRHEARFKTMLNEGTIQNMALFLSKLENELADIRDKITIINHSLSAIDYNDGTYIELLAEYSRDTQVRQFRQDLKACMGETLVGKADEDYNEHKFMQVKAIIDRFKGREGRADLDHRWTKKVTDVRSWLIFSASERWREDDGDKEFFSDTSGKSGGQKEKLAYTILAAALAYQFGLKWGEKRSNSFRFVMIDEAFGRGSDESTRYALELFKRLDLQLLIVTPMQKTHIIEDYVQSVHFIHNQEGKNSMIRNLTIEEFQEEKQAYHGGLN